MAVRDYREMYIMTILTLGRDHGLSQSELNRSYFARLSFDELRELAQKLQG
jgi:hypothetical protein